MVRYKAMLPLQKTETIGGKNPTHLQIGMKWNQSSYDFSIKFEVFLYKELQHSPFTSFSEILAL